LHNFTSNEYYIKINAPLIDIEFTKLSTNDKWNLDAARQAIVEPLDFNNVGYVPRKLDEDRDIYKYIKESLTAESKFALKNTKKLFINSSMEEEINKMKRTQTSIKKNMRGLRRFETFFAFTVGTVIIAAVSLIIGIKVYFHNAKEIPETQKKIIEQQAIIDELENRINKLEDRYILLEDEP
jgi:cell division protein FtsL